MLVSPTDFVMVRFATQPWHFMRMGHRDIGAWLVQNDVTYTEVKQVVYFQLPDFLEQYGTITPQLARALAPFAREIKRRLHAISWSVMGKFRQPLTHEELRLLAENHIPIIL